jgi:DNA-3-methyladenine glycosylase II
VTPPRRLDRASIARAVEVLSARDPDLAAIARRHGPPPLWGRQPGFPTLVRIILEQQVSLAAARTMYLRLHAHSGGVTPERIERLGPDGLRSLGFTRQKAAYCHGLAARIGQGELDLSRLAGGADDEGMTRLREVPGLGPWSVDIYYLMALRRPDIWPRGDLALATALAKVKRLRSRPTAERQARFAAGWAPWRSVAARMLWQDYLAARGASA